MIVTIAKSGPQNTDLSKYLQISEMGGSKGVLEIDSFVAEQLELLGLEREAEIAEASVPSNIELGESP